MEEREVYDLLKELAEIPGPVGREEPVQKFLEREWGRCGFKVSYDRVGNLFGKRSGEGSHLAIAGHADQVGFIVSQILPDGFVKVTFNTATTAPDGRYLSGTEIRFITGHEPHVSGCFGLKCGHLASPEERRAPVIFQDLFVDLGLDSAEMVRKTGVDVGTSAVFGAAVRRIQDNIVGPAMDNRVAGVVQCMLARKLRDMAPGPGITLISTVQEEIGIRGAASAAKREEYDYVITIDVGLTGDIPAAKDCGIETKLGAGPIILYKDFSIHYSSALISKLEGLAKDASIPFQRGVFRNYQTDGAHFFKHGNPTALVAVPCRYTHTHFETVRITDIMNTIELLEKFIRGC